VVELITSALQAAALQRSAVPESQANPVSTSVLNLASDNLTSNSGSETSGLVFGPSAGFFSSNEAFLTVAQAGNYSSNSANTFTANAFSSGNNSGASRQLEELLSGNTSEQIKEPVNLPTATAENLVRTSGETVVTNETSALIESASSDSTEIENLTSAANNPVISSSVQDITTLEPSFSPGNIGEENEQNDS
jgi:hypothetical protein